MDEKDFSLEELADKNSLREITKQFCKDKDNAQLEKAFIEKLNSECPGKLTSLRLAIDHFLKNPTEKTAKTSLKEAILSLDSSFLTAYQQAKKPDEGEIRLDVDELSIIYTAIFKQAISGDNQLKISHIPPLTIWQKEEDNYLVSPNLPEEEEQNQSILVNRLNTLVAFIQDTYPLPESVTKIRENLINHIVELLDNSFDKKTEKKLEAIKTHINVFFENRLFYDNEKTMAFIRSNQENIQNILNDEQAIKADPEKIKRIGAEFCLQQAAHAIALHAQTYKTKHPKDAEEAEKLSQSMSQTISNFFKDGDFSAEKNQQLTENLSNAFKAEHPTLAKHRGWGEIIENLALVLSSFVIVGLPPALFKFYQHTVKGNSTFSYFKPETQRLAEKTVKLAKNMAPNTDNDNDKPSTHTPTPNQKTS